MHARATDIAAWLRARVAEAGARGLTFGLSGGVDSAVVAGLCSLAMPGHVIGLIMPCGRDPDEEAENEADAHLVANGFKIPVARLDLAPAFDALTGGLEAVLAPRPGTPSSQGGGNEVQERAALANVKPRLRMTSLYLVANRLSYLVAGTRDRCELTIGLFTKFGDGGADVLPIGTLLKSEVRALARDLGVPDRIIDKPPSEGLWPGQTDEEELGFTYESLERYLRDGPDGVPPAIALRIERLIRATEHKRAPLPMPDTD